MDKSIRCPAKDRPPVRILAPQHCVVGYREPARIVGIVGKDQNLPTALLQPRLRRRAVMHRAARFSAVSERYQAASGSLPSCAVAIPAAKTMQKPIDRFIFSIVPLADVATTGRSYRL